MQLEKENRRIIAQKIFDLGNFAIAALIFGVMISKQYINWWLVSLGIIFYISCLFIGMMLLKRK